ncbi:MAG: tetratricopeptide repeat protein [Candidatus Adiutrix sp.]|jgi:tetratricopeptide (TPR) repeat protein|nr:tetratricopeptide repeat protein [Candidatus Adiutrix sp.]
MVWGCGGKLPPPDPARLAEAKDGLNQGNYWYERGCYRESERFFQGGLESARLSDNVLLIILAQNSLGAAALAQGETAAAADYLEQALNIASGHPGQPGLDKVLGNLGALAYRLGRSQEARDFWSQAAELALERGQSPALYYCDLARLYLETGPAEEFAQLAAQALAAAQLHPEDQVTLADALNLAGQAARAAGETALAEERFRQALELDRRTENTVGLAQDTESLGLLLIQLEHYSEAAGLLDRAFFLWLAAANDQSADRVLTTLQKLSRDHRFPRKIEPYQTVRRQPEPHRLAGRCP